MAYTVRVYSFSQSGNELCERICNIKHNIFRCEKLHFEKCNESNLTEELFTGCSAHIFVGAAGIAVRKIAQFISDKKSDPAVIVIDEKGQHIIPILSGHIGGANDLSKIIADYLDAKVILTTATDVNEFDAIDSITARSRLEIEPKDAARIANSKMLRGEKIKVSIGEDIEVINDKSSVYEIVNPNESDVSVLNNKKYIVGIGCRKNIDTDIFEKTLDEILLKNNVSSECIDRMASIDLKQSEEAILKYTKKNSIMFETYSADELNGVSGDFDESDFVKEVTGTSNVSERVCVFAGSMLGRGEFILKRQAKNGITVSIYRVIKRIDLNGKA